MLFMYIFLIIIITMTIYADAATLASWSNSQQQRNPYYPGERKNMLYFNMMVKEPVLAFPEDLQMQQKHDYVSRMEARTTETGSGMRIGSVKGGGKGSGSASRGWSGQNANPKDVKVLENYHRIRENGSQELKTVLSNGMINYQYLEFVPTNLPNQRLKPIQTGYYTIPVPDATTGHVRYLTTHYRADDDGFRVIKTVLSSYNPAHIYKTSEQQQESD